MRTATLFVLFASLAILAACSPAKPQNFETPEAAVQGLIDAAKTGEVKPVLKVLGEDAKPLIESGDPVADKNGRAEFVAGYEEAHFLDKTIADAITLEVGPDKWPFDQSFFLKLNSAVGGSWGGQKGIDDSVFPQKFYVDYVRVYQRAAPEK